MIRGSGYSKSRLAKAAGAEVALKQRKEKWHAAVAGRAFKSKCTKQARVGAIFQVPICKNGTPLWRKSKGTKHHMLGAIFQVQKWHAAVARITFASQNAQKLTGSGHFLKFRCRKMARGCGAKHMCKSKCTKCLCLEHFLKFRCRKCSQLVSYTVSQSISHLINQSGSQLVS